MWFCFAVLVLGVPGAFAANEEAPIHKVSSVVRTDARTGRLVRSVVVTPKPVIQTVVKPQTPGAPARTVPKPAATDLRELVNQTAKVYGVEPALVHSVVEVESNYNPYAISSAGAEGLMQLMPATARRFGVSNSFDAQKNVEGGVKYLKYLQDLYGNDLRRVLAAYNAGEGAVAKSPNGIPRIAETQNYVYQVGKRLGQKRSAVKPEQPAAPARPEVVPEHRHVEQYTDEEGRIFFRTR